MSRQLFLTATFLAVACIAVTVHAQCGGGYQYGGYAPLYSNYRYSRPYYNRGYSQQRYYYPQSNYYQPRQIAPANPPGYQYGGYSTPLNSPAYSAPQGSGSRAYDSAPVYQPQPTYQLAPTYSQPAHTYTVPQESGSRIEPSQGSGSR